MACYFLNVHTACSPAICSVFETYPFLKSECIQESPQIWSGWAVMINNTGQVIRLPLFHVSFERVCATLTGRECPTLLVTALFVRSTQQKWVELLLTSFLLIIRPPSLHCSNFQHHGSRHVSLCTNCSCFRTKSWKSCQLIPKFLPAWRFGEAGKTILQNCMIFHDQGD